MTAGTGIEGLFTTALGLQPPWEVVQVQLDTSLRRIDFEVRCTAKRLACPHCGLHEQGIHDRLRRSWRHLDFFQYEAWLHADVPRVACGACGNCVELLFLVIQLGFGVNQFERIIHVYRIRHFLQTALAAHHQRAGDANVHDGVLFLVQFTR